MTARLKSMRQGTWTGDAASARDVGEAFRDIFGWLSKVSVCEVIPVINAVWSEPFSVAVSRRPQIVLLGDARLAGTLQAVAHSGGEWQAVENSRVTFAGVQGLQRGVAYDLKFLAVY